MHSELPEPGWVQPPRPTIAGQLDEEPAAAVSSVDEAPKVAMAALSHLQPDAAETPSDGTLAAANVVAEESALPQPVVQEQQQASAQTAKVRPPAIRKHKVKRVPLATVTPPAQQPATPKPIRMFVQQPLPSASDFGEVLKSARQSGLQPTHTPL